MTTAIYLRVSTQMQADANGVDAQVHAIRQYCTSHGIDYDACMVYKDLAVSGAKSKRPEFDRMNSEIQAGKVDTVIVYSLSRAGRSAEHLHVWTGFLAEKKVRFVSVKESIDLSTAIGKAFFGMLAVFAQFERDNLRERVRDGVRSKLASGAKWGGATQISKAKGFRKLNDNQERAVRESNLTAPVLAQKYGVHRNTISKIKRKVQS